MQTSAQLTAGFLLTLPFQTAFADLNKFQEGLYLGLVLLASLIIVMVMTPVAVHRHLSGEHVKEKVVDTGHRIVRTVIAALALLILGIVTLIYDVVVDQTIALVVAGCVGVVLIALLFFWCFRPGSPATRGHDPAARRRARGTAVLHLLLRERAGRGPGRQARRSPSVPPVSPSAAAEGAADRAALRRPPAVLPRTRRAGPDGGLARQRHPPRRDTDPDHLAPTRGSAGPSRASGSGSTRGAPSAATRSPCRPCRPADSTAGRVACASRTPAGRSPCRSPTTTTSWRGTSPPAASSSPSTGSRPSGSPTGSGWTGRARAAPARWSWSATHRRTRPRAAHRRRRGYAAAGCGRRLGLAAAGAGAQRRPRPAARAAGPPGPLRRPRLHGVRRRHGVPGVAAPRRPAGQPGRADEPRRRLRRDRLRTGLLRPLIEAGRGGRPMGPLENDQSVLVTSHRTPTSFRRE